MTCSKRLAIALLVAAICVGQSPSGSTAADQASIARDIPKAWADYAVLASLALQEWFAGPAPEAQRMQAYFEAMYSHSGDRLPLLPLSIWVDESGRISRIRHTEFIHPQANDDLRVLIVGRQLPERPPPEMLQPMRLKLRLRLRPNN